MRLHNFTRFALGFVLLVATRAGAAAITPNPASLKFPDTGTGICSNPMTVTITNTSMQNVTVNTITFTGANPGDFAGIEGLTVIAVPAPAD